MKNGANKMPQDSYLLNSNGPKFVPKDPNNYTFSEFKEGIGRCLHGQDSKAVMDEAGWLLYFYNYQPPIGQRSKTCKEILWTLTEDQKQIDQEHFWEKVQTFYTIFNFDLRSFEQVWEYEHKIENIIPQTVWPHTKIRNRFKNAKKSKMVKISPLETSLKIPKITQECKYLVFPVIITRYIEDYHLEKRDLDGFGEGIFIVDGESNLIDCMKINDFWLLDEQLSLRRKHLYRAKDSSRAMEFVCWNFDDLEKAIPLLYDDVEALNVELETNDLFNIFDFVYNENPPDLLIREMGRDLYNPNWFRWNKDSYYLFSVDKNNSPRLSPKRGSKKAKFFDLYGEKVEKLDNEAQKRGLEAVLDKRDIKNFKRILKYEVKKP